MEKQKCLAGIATVLLCIAGAQRSGIASPPAETQIKGMPPLAAAKSEPTKTATFSANTFGIALFQECARSSGDRNLFLSPASVYFALLMVYNGAGGATNTTIAKALRLVDNGVDMQTVNKENAALMRSLTARVTKVDLSIANAIWVDEKSHFTPEFVDRVKSSYNGSAESLKFRTSRAADTINAWAAKNTQNKIRDVISSSQLVNNNAVLTNAVYFKGIWTHAFRKADTELAPFHRAARAGGDNKVPMMYMALRTGYIRTNEFEAVRLPYGDGRFAMYAYLPSKSSNISSFIAGLTSEDFAAWQKSLVGGEAFLALGFPRFKMSYENNLDDPLKTLGMGSIFEPGANFLPMGLDHSCMGSVLHKALLEVDEEGATAVAVTTVVMNSSATSIEKRPYPIVFDRPFFCAICDDKTGAILFAGTVNDPQ